MTIVLSYSKLKTMQYFVINQDSENTNIKCTVYLIQNNLRKNYRRPKKNLKQIKL